MGRKGPRGNTAALKFKRNLIQFLREAGHENPSICVQMSDRSSKIQLLPDTLEAFRKIVDLRNGQLSD